MSNDLTVKEIISSNWPNAKIVVADTSEQCIKSVISGETDGALIATYTAQKLARDDVQNRLRTDIVQSVSTELRMAVNADIDRDFYSLWAKTLLTVSAEIQDGIIEKYVDTPSMESSFTQYLFDHPFIWVLFAAAVLSSIFLAVMYTQSVKSRNRQRAISDELALALDVAKAATAVKNEFFSKMSHDIRTPLNAVLGMSQIAKYINDPTRLNEALDNISSEGKYLLTLINSILDVNQLERGSLTLNNAPFYPAKCVKSSIDLLMPMAMRTDRQLLNGKRVLLAEGNALNAEIASELMQSLGITADWAENGAIAAEKFENSTHETYFAVFMDMQMPVMDGVTATLNSRHADHGIPIIAMTANTFDADRQRCIDAGMNGYISKPIDSDSIAEALLRYI